MLYYFGTTSGSDRAVRFYATAGGVWKAISGQFTLPLNTWTNVSLSFDASLGGQIYNNGLPIGPRTPLPGLLYKNSTNLLLGNRFPGKIDDLHIYNRSLTDQEILDIYNAGK